MIQFKSELILKIISSILFRVILVVYSVFLLIYNHSVLAWYVYLIAIVLYIVAYKKLLTYNKHFLRTLNDYCFIFLILFDKNILDISNLILLLFPIFNSPNHLNHNRSPMLLFFLTSVFFLIIYFMHNSYENHILLYILGFLFLTFIGFLEMFRRSAVNRLLKIYDQIDMIASEKTFSSFHIHKVYSAAIEGLNSIFDKHNSIDLILGFVRHNKNRLSIRSTSRFVLKYEVDALNKRSLEDQVGINFPIRLDGVVYNNTLFININSYVFVVIFNKEMGKFVLFYSLVAYELITPVLKKITRILDFETALNKRKLENIKKLNADLHYVNDIVKSTHFLKNKFTPIKTYFQITQRLDHVDEDKKNDLLELLEITKSRALISLESIESKTLQVLDKTNSPFASYSLKKMKYKHIYMLVKDIWIEYFSDENINVLCSTDDMEKRCSPVSRNLLEFLFTDVIENIRKYSSGHQSITFTYDQNAKIILRNEVHEVSKKKNELIELVDNFNNLDRLEINRRNSFGLVHILELSELLNIKCKLSFDDQKYFTTTLIFGAD